ncbi:MAG: hypothetical protein QXN68_03985 [Thermoplasmata archaeon]
MVNKKIAYKILYGYLTPEDLTFKPAFANGVYQFLDISHMESFFEELISTISEDVSYVIFWQEHDKFIIDIPETEGKIFVLSNSQFLFDMFEDICKKYIPKVLIY